MVRRLRLGLFISLLLTGPALAQTATTEETPKAEAPTTETAAPEPAPDESAPVIDWTARATEAFAANYKEACAPQEPAERLEIRKPDIYEMKYRENSDTADQPDRMVTLYRFFCNSGAYNELHVFFMKDSYGELQPLTFAEPTIHVNYENEDSEGKVLGMKIIGMESHTRLVNSEVDAAKNTVASFSKWRGVGDASSTGLWVLKDGKFVLSTYDVDASYDGEINPINILDYRAENEILNETP